MVGLKLRIVGPSKETIIKSLLETFSGYVNDNERRIDGESGVDLDWGFVKDPPSLDGDWFYCDVL